MLLVNWNAKVAYLQSLNQSGFTAWLDQALQGNSHPLWIPNRDCVEIGIFVAVDLWSNAKKSFKNKVLSIINFLCYFFAGKSPYPKSISFKNKITSATNTLATKWDIEKGYEYLGELVYIIGRTGMPFGRKCPAFNRILSLLESEKLKGIFSDMMYAANKQDLHLNSLRAMLAAAKKGSPRLVKICERDINDDHYFGICYNLLTEPETKGFYSLIAYFPDFIRFCQRNGNFYFLNMFGWISGKWGEQLLCDLNPFLLLLTAVEQEFFWAELQSVLAKYDKIDEKNT